VTTQEVHIYSTCPVVELFVNGKLAGAARPDATRIFRWPAVTLIPGTNRIEAVAERDGVEYRASCEWVLTRDSVGAIESSR
jgi:beta-galactosidase